MPIDFPNNPSAGQTYSYGGQKWQYNGVAWDKIITATIPLGGICGSIQYNDGASGLSGNSNFYYDGTNVVLVDPTHLDGDILGGVHHYAHNNSGVGITRGWPVYITGMDGASTIIRIATADASNSSKMPAIGLAESDIANGAFGHITMFGTMLQTDTSGYATNQTLYVAPGGGLTSGRPSASNQLIQNIGKVGRVHPNTGSLIVMGPGRSNDVPNIVPVRSWLEMPSGQTATSIVTLFNGLSGPVTGVGSVRGLTGAVGITNGSGIGLSVSGQTMTFSNTGVLSIDGGTGAITNVARTNVDNIFSASQTINTSNAALSIVDSSSFNEVSFQGEFNRLYFYNDLSSGEVYLQPTIAAASTIIVSLPDYTTTLAGLAGTQTFTGINTFNALTNFPGGISAAGATFSGLARFTAGISAAGGTFGGNLRLQNGEFLQNTTNGRIDFMPAPIGSTHYGLYVDTTSWGFGPRLGTIRSSDNALNVAGILWDAALTVGTNVDFNLGSNQAYKFRATLPGNGNSTLQVGVANGLANYSGSLAIMDFAWMGNTAARAPGVSHANPNLYVYRAGASRANDFIRFEHDGNFGRIVSGGTSGISIEPGSGILGISGGVCGGYGLNANSFGLTSGFDIIPASWDSITAPMGAPGTVANRLYLAAISIPSRCTIKTFATQQGTSSAGNTGNIFLGLYNTNIHGLPQNLVAQSSSQSLTTTNFAVIRASNINYTANPGNYWLAICFSASGLSGGIGRPGTPMKFITATSSSPIGQSMNWGLYVTQSGFTLSTSLSGATFTAITTNTDFPAIFYTAEGL